MLGILIAKNLLLIMRQSKTIRNKKFIGIVAKTEVPSIIGVKTSTYVEWKLISSTKWDSEKKRMEICLKSLSISWDTISL
jgi:hypothetical protein